MSEKLITWMPDHMFVADVLGTFGGLKGMNAKKISRRGTVLTITLKNGNQVTINPMDTVRQEVTGELTVERWKGFP